MRLRLQLLPSVTVLLASSLLLSCQRPGEAESVEGNRLAAKGDFGPAAERYRAATAKAPKEARLHELLGNARWANGELQLAREAWLEAVQLDPKQSVEAQLGLSRLDAERNEVTAAVERATRVVDRWPERPDARVTRALALLQRADAGDHTQALADLDVALKMSPADPSALYARAMALLSLRRLPETKEACAALDKAAPDSPFAAWANARLAAAESRRADVILYLRRAKAAAKGASQAERFKNDPAFRFMSEDPDFARER